MSDVLWLDRRLPALRRARLSGPADVAIVGGGVTGLACAFALARHGLAVRVHEARAIGSGASGRNGGFALGGGAMPYERAREQLGRDGARTLWRLAADGLDRMQALAGDALVRGGSLRLAADVEERAAIEREHAALREDGFEVECIDPLPPHLAATFHGALRFPGDGSLDPARWLARLASHATDAGAELREHDAVTDVAALDAPTVVIATDGYTRGLVPELDAAVRPVRNQVLATAPLRERLYEQPHYARYGFDYWQQLPDGRLVLGGGRDADAEAEETAEEALTALIQARLEATLERLLGRRPEITHRWAGIFGATRDRLPLAGRLPGRDGVWVAAGYSGHGNVLGLVCGELVAAAIAGLPARGLELFDPALRLEAGDVR